MGIYGIFKRTDRKSKVYVKKTYCGCQLLRSTHPSGYVSWIKLHHKNTVLLFGYNLHKLYVLPKRWYHPATSSSWLENVINERIILNNKAGGTRGVGMIRRQVVVFCHTSHCQPSELLPDEARREREDGRLIGPLSLHAESPRLWQATGKKEQKPPAK